MKPVSVQKTREQAPVASQQWRDRKFCQEYAETWEISTSEVHYGWLSPGENTLRLLEDVFLEGATILDIGCGMGENLMGLAKRGGVCFGIDISEHMLRYARNRNPKLELVREDMRQFTSFIGISFDLILSIYSLEYLESLKEFRDVLANLFSRLRPGGTFVFCFSHPLQHLRHSRLRNESATTSTQDNSPLIYSFKDVVLCLNETGFTIDRIIEQRTINPSQITYEDSLVFPYHFHEEKNPCSPLLDKDSNAAPHTIIYKVKKPDGGLMMQRQMSLKMQFGGVRIWGEYRRVIDSVYFQVLKKKFRILKLEPRDAVVGICSVFQLKITKQNVRNGKPIKISVATESQNVLRNSLLGIIFMQRKEWAFGFHFQQDWIALPEHRKLLSSYYISRIDPIFGEFINVFPNKEIGVLIFVNGEEPGNGKVGLQDYFPSVGDLVEVVYVACDRGGAKSGDFVKDDKQLDLFSLPLFAVHD